MTADEQMNVVHRRIMLLREECMRAKDQMEDGGMIRGAGKLDAELVSAIKIWVKFRTGKLTEEDY